MTAFGTVPYYQAQARDEQERERAQQNGQRPRGQTATGPRPSPADIDEKMREFADFATQQTGERIDPDTLPDFYGIRGAELTKSDDPEDRRLGDRFMDVGDRLRRERQAFAQQAQQGQQQPTYGQGMAQGIFQPQDVPGSQAQQNFGMQQGLMGDVAAQQAQAGVPQQMTLPAIQQAAQEALQRGDQQGHQILNSAAQYMAQAQGAAQQNQQGQAMLGEVQRMNAGQPAQAANLTPEQQQRLQQAGQPVDYSGSILQDEIAQQQAQRQQTMDRARQTSLDRINQQLPAEEQLGPDATDQERYEAAQDILEAQGQSEQADLSPEERHQRRLELVRNARRRRREMREEAGLQGEPTPGSLYGERIDPDRLETLRRSRMSPEIRQQTEQRETQQREQQEQQAQRAHETGLQIIKTLGQDAEDAGIDPQQLGRIGLALQRAEKWQDTGRVYPEGHENAGEPIYEINPEWQNLQDRYLGMIQQMFGQQQGGGEGGGDGSDGNALPAKNQRVPGQTRIQRNGRTFVWTENGWQEES